MVFPTHLPFRSVLSVSGPDGAGFLNGLVTQSIPDLGEGARRWGALLAPQGKIIADFLVERQGDAFFLDCAASARDELLQRLQRFRLRAQVEIAPRDDLCVAAFTGSPDPRSAAAPARALLPASEAPGADSLSAYHAARIRAGLAEGGIDFASLDVFPADINMDLLGGVDFRKGCFVGQEVVSRIKRRGVARRRTLAVDLSGTPGDGLPQKVTAGEEEIGLLTSVADGVGLIRVRIDRITADTPLRAGGVSLQLRRPDWLAAEIEALAAPRA